MKWPGDISGEEHNLLLGQLPSLPSGGRVQELESELKEGLAQYHKLLGELENTVRGSIANARKIKGLGPPDKDLPRGQE